MSGRDRRRVERVRRVREIEAELALAELRRSRAERFAAQERCAEAERELGAWSHAHTAGAPAGLFALRRAGLGAQAQFVARAGIDVDAALTQEEADRVQWAERARKVEGLERLIGRIREEEHAEDLRAEAAVLDEFVVSRAQREHIARTREAR